MFSGLDISLQTADRSVFTFVAAVVLGLAAFAATQAHAGQPGKITKSNPLQHISFVAKPIAGPILDPKLVTAANSRPVFVYRSIDARAPKQVEMSHEQMVKFIAAGHRPPETGPLADLFRSARPVMAPETPVAKPTDVNIAMAGR